MSFDSNKPTGYSLGGHEGKGEQEREGGGCMNITLSKTEKKKTHKIFFISSYINTLCFSISIPLGLFFFSLLFFLSSSSVLEEIKQKSKKLKKIKKKIKKKLKK